MVKFQLLLPILVNGGFWDKIKDSKEINSVKEKLIGLWSKLAMKKSPHIFSTFFLKNNSLNIRCFIVNKISDTNFSINFEKKMMTNFFYPQF